MYFKISVSIGLGVSDEIKEVLEKYDIKYKENAKNIIIVCPFCLEEGKEKIKLYIDKERLIWHCFRCENSGSIRNIHKVFEKHGIPRSELNDILLRYIEQGFISYSDGTESTQNIVPIEYLIQEARKKVIQELTEKAEIVKKIRSYELISFLHRRGIDVFLFYAILGKIAYYGLRENLEKRLIVPTFFGTSYEARLTYNSDKKPKYIKAQTSGIQDFVMFEFNVNEKIHSSWNDNILIAFEGLMDAMKYFLHLYRYGYPFKGVNNKTYILSLGGYSSVLGLPEFLKLLERLKNIKINTVVVVYDSDINLASDKMIKMHKKIKFENPQYNFFFISFNVNGLKDYGDVSSIQEFKAFNNLVLNLTRHRHESVITNFEST